MKELFLTAFALIFMGGLSAAHAAPKVGEPAPAFSAKDASGKMVSLADLKGKVTVLEWTNHECPFVVKHYGSGNMQALQKEARAKGVEWVSIISSAPGRQGHISDDEALKIAADKGASPSAIVRDESGEIGKLYDAKTTPHMFVINAEGVLVYAGAIDSNSSPRASTIEGADNYVSAALDAVLAGQPVQVAQTQPYGCSVKY